MRALDMPTREEVRKTYSDDCSPQAFTGQVTWAIVVSSSLLSPISDAFYAMKTPFSLSIKCYISLHVSYSPPPLPNSAPGTALASINPFPNDEALKEHIRGRLEKVYFGRCLLCYWWVKTRSESLWGCNVDVN